MDQACAGGHALLPCNNGRLISCPNVDQVSGPYQSTRVRWVFARSPDGGQAWNLSWRMHIRCLDRPVHTIAVITAFCVCVWAMLHFGLASSATQFAGFVIGGVLCNALVTGALSGAHDRYMARVIWLVCVAAGLCLAVHMHMSKKHSSGRS